MTLTVVIPAYKVSHKIKDVITTLPDFVNNIIVVDDACPEGSGKIVEAMQNDKVMVIYHRVNKGVGGVVKTGYLKALEVGSDIIIKMDGDGQMDPEYLESLIEPILKGKADYTKGNRFVDFKALKAMPKIRIFGNSILSFITKIASGYWNITDPTNGYTAINRGTLKRLDLSKISDGYFFESDMLINLYLYGAAVKDISIPARYKDEKSSLRIKRVLFDFPPRLFKGFVKRIFYRYFIYDFNMASVYILIGLPIFIMSVAFGIYEWLESIVTNMPRTAGTIMLVALPLIVSFQMLLQAISIDISNIPKKD